MQVFGSQSFQAFACAQNTVAERVSVEKCGGKVVQTYIVGGVFRFAYFLEDDFAFTLEVVGVEFRVQTDIRQNVETFRKVRVARKGVKTSVRFGGVGVYLRAYGIDVVDDVEHAASVRTLEHHMLYKVRNARLCGGLVYGTRFHKNTRRNRTHRGIFVDNEPQPVVQFNQFSHTDIISHIRAGANII